MSPLVRSLVLAGFGFCVLPVLPAHAQFVCGPAGVHPVLLGLTVDLNVFGSIAGGVNALACGQGATANGASATAVGINATAGGVLSIAHGNGSTANGDGSIALGAGATVTGLNGVAIGVNAQATFGNSMAIGSGAQATGANEIVIGTAANTYTLPGISSAASRGAQVGDIRIVTSDQQGHLATASVSELFPVGAINSINSRLAEQSARIDQNTSGVAIALAMANGSILPPGKNFSLSANWGGFEGRNAFAAAGTAKLTSDLYLTAGLGVSDNTTGARAGLTWAW